MTVTLDLTTLTEDQKEAFYAEFYTHAPNDDDGNNPSPWGCPWCFETTIEVTGATPAEWAKSWWEQNRNEIDSLTPLFVFSKTGGSWDLNVTTVYNFRQKHDIENYQDWRRQGGTIKSVMDFLKKEDAINFIETKLDDDLRQEFIEIIEEG